MSTRKRSFLPWLFLIPVLYVVSIPPLVRLDKSGYFLRGSWQWQVGQVYCFPWVVVLEKSSDPIQHWLWRYTLLLSPEGWSP